VNTYQRLSVNINTESAEALRDSMSSRNISATEAVRRALGLLAMAERGELTNGLCHSCDQSIESCPAYHPEYGFTCVIPAPGHNGTHFDRAGGHWTPDGQVFS
jgi:hypothetical protein